MDLKRSALPLLAVFSVFGCSRDTQGTGNDLSGVVYDLGSFIEQEDFSSVPDSANGSQVDSAMPVADLSTLHDLTGADLVFVAPTCGDGHCNGTETAASCAADCSPDTCATLAPCTTGTRIFVLYTQDASALCTTHMICGSGGGGCKVGNNDSFIALCTSASPSSYCSTTVTYGGHLGYTDCM